MRIVENGGLCGRMYGRCCNLVVKPRQSSAEQGEMRRDEARRGESNW